MLILHTQVADNGFIATQGHLIEITNIREYDKSANIKTKHKVKFLNSVINKLTLNLNDFIEEIRQTNEY
jgi:hypothetical protein